MTMLLHASPVEPEPRKRDFYVDALQSLDEAGVRYVVGGTYAVSYYTGIERSTKDMDIFVKPEDRDRCLTTLTAAGYRTEFFYPFWIAKALCGDDFIDVIYSSGNGLCVVDDEWLAHAVEYDVHGYRTRLSPAEEQLWSKAFVQDRDRYDGADVAHLILRRGDCMDWPRLVRRFHGHEPVLLAHLTLFNYIYPGERDKVPAWVMDQLREAVERDRPARRKICRGTFIAQKSYLVDVKEWGYRDAREKPLGPLSDDEINQLPQTP